MEGIDAKIRNVQLNRIKYSNTDGSYARQDIAVRFIDAGPASAAMFFIKVCLFHRRGYLRMRLRPNAASSVSHQKNQRSRIKFRVYLIYLPFCP